MEQDESTHAGSWRNCDALHAWLEALRDEARRPCRTAVIVAHADDEVVGLGAHLPRLRHCFFVHVTNGGPEDGCDARAHGFGSVPEYVAARRAELESALALAGLGRARRFELACPDQQATYRLVELARSLRDILRTQRAELVVTHPYEGGHPDHDATAFAVHAACALLGTSAPPLIEASSYHNSPTGIETSCFIPVDGVEAVPLELTARQRHFKRRLMNCFTSQRSTLAYFPIAMECFRPAPRYDFTRPPHAGALFYEGFDWGMRGERFRDLAGAALRELDLAAEP
jgi:LmbE family N-acetylglucosaminyl deacetylase